MLKAYASYFISFLIDELKDLSNINKIILFGSVAKDEATKESDIDIFIELEKEFKKDILKIEGILKEFYKSREAMLFKVKGTDNKINLIIGKLDKWPDLRESIESTGIVFYGRYVSTKIRGKKNIIIFWDNIKKNRGAFLNKIYGFKVGEKRYSGLIEILNGKKLGKSSILLPIEHRNKILDLIKKYGVNAKIIEVYA